MPTNETSPDLHPVRSPNADERRQLAGWLRNQGHEEDTATELVETACVAVFDDYASDGPGYAGKLMTVVWGGGPSFFDVFIWEGEWMIRSDRDYE